MQKIELYVEEKYIYKIMNMLKKYKNSGIVNIVTQEYANNTEKSAFGILKGKIEDPVQWQERIRNENERDIYNSV